MRTEICRKCFEPAHKAEDCQSGDRGGYHCIRNHYTGSKACPQFKQKEEIMAIQARERISSGQASLFLEKRNPNINGYASAVKSSIANREQVGARIREWKTRAAGGTRKCQRPGQVLHKQQY